jgi:enoyl-CoA hydratase
MIGLPKACRSLAYRIAANSPLAVALAKDAALQALETSLAQGLEHEKRNFHVAVHSADSHEGQAAFLAKRAPEFTGK